MVDKTTKVIIGIAAVLAVAVIIMLIFSSTDPSVTGNVTNNGGSKEVITFGFVGPLTGDISFIGQQNKAAIEVAVDEINAEGGIDGKQVKVIYEDGKCNAKEAAAAGSKLINVDKVDYIIGGECSGETLAIAPLAEQEKVLMISPTSSSPDVTNAGDYVFRNYNSDNDAGKWAARKLYDLGYRKVAVLWSINDYAEGYSKVFRDEFTSLGGEIVFQEKFEQGTSDLRTTLSKVKSSDAEAIFFIEYTAGSITFFKQKQELNINLPVFGTDTQSDPEIVKAVGSAADGAKYVLAAESYSAEFTQKIKDKTGESVIIGSPQSYDAVYILKQAIEAVGDDPTKVKDYLYTMPAYHGEAGETKFDENGDLAEAAYVLWEIKNGQSVLIE